MIIFVSGFLVGYVKRKKKKKSHACIHSQYIYIHTYTSRIAGVEKMCVQTDNSVCRLFSTAWPILYVYCILCGSDTAVLFFHSVSLIIRIFLSYQYLFFFLLTALNIYLFLHCFLSLCMMLARVMYRSIINMRNDECTRNWNLIIERWE